MPQPQGLSHGYLMLSAEPRQGDAGGELFVQALKQVRRREKPGEPWRKGVHKSPGDGHS